MTNLDFTWKARLSDETEINQIDGKKETLFSEVEKNKNKLASFRIENTEGEYYEADLFHGIIDCNGKLTKEFTEASPQLVYMRRNQVRVDAISGKKLSARVIHIIGLKNEDGNISTTVEVFAGLSHLSKKVLVKRQSFNKVEEEDITANV